MKRNKIVAILVARQGSSRMPGKSMAEIMGRPVTWYVIDRLKKMDLFDSICLATSDHPRDKELLDLANVCDIVGFAGDQEDVLSRIYNAAEYCNADVIVEIGGDCPFVDYEVVKKSLDLLEESKSDFVTNIEIQTYPDGIDIFALKFSTIKKAHEKAIVSSQRLHPFSYIHKHQGEFKILNFENSENLSRYRWTLDYEEDFNLVKTVFESLWKEDSLFNMQDILKLYEQKPELYELNSKWALDKPSAEVPAYWYTKAYIQDMLNDINKLALDSKTLEINESYNECVHYYKEMKSLIEELYERAKTFSKN